MRHVMAQKSDEVRSMNNANLIGTGIAALS